MTEFIINFECIIPDETYAAFDKLFQLASPRCISTMHIPMPRARLPSDVNASTVPLGEWSTFAAGMAGAEPLIEQPVRLMRYQPQDGDGPAWVEYGVWNYRPAHPAVLEPEHVSGLEEGKT